MTTCTELSDRMPAAALGQRGWTPAEAEHLERCADCRAEWELVRGAARLGTREAWRLDAAAVALGALAQAAAARPGPTHYRRWLVGGLAAAAAVVLLVRVMPSHESVRGSTTSTGSAAAALAIPALDSLSEDELRLVLAGVSGASFGADAEFDAPGLESLDSTGLEQVLTTMEGT
jgi:hypothetical protein